MNKIVAKGFSIGVIAPIITLIVYITFVLELDIDAALSKFQITNTLSHHISLSVFLTNIILFFMHLKTNKQNVAKGILAATFIYVFIVLYIRFF